MISTCKHLTMLLAPKTLWALMNLMGSVGGKYGERRQLSVHRRRRTLQAPQGLCIPVPPPWRERVILAAAAAEEDEKGASETVFSAYTIIREEGARWMNLVWTNTQKETVEYYCWSLPSHCIYFTCSIRKCMPSWFSKLRCVDIDVDVPEPRTLFIP